MTNGQVAMNLLSWAQNEEMVDTMYTEHGRACLLAATIVESAMDLALASKLASVVVHADELLSDDGHRFDLEALRQVVNDPAVAAWVKSLGPLAPVKRRA